MKIKEAFNVNIDTIQDGVDFKMQLFNEGQYDKNEFRTIIRNTGLKLDIINRLPISLEIENIFFGIIRGRKLSNLYSSNQLFEILPKMIQPNEIYSTFFYGWQVKEKLLQFKDEEGVFLCSTDNKQKYFKSSKFSGDNIEKQLIYLEDDELANWGNKKYNPLDTEVIY